MAKDPRIIDKRIPFVMALLIGLFCYYTWAPNSPFKQRESLSLERALANQQSGLVEGDVLVMGNTNSEQEVLAKSAEGKLLTINFNQQSTPAIGSFWQVKGMLSWPENAPLLKVSQASTPTKQSTESQ
ncbi:hypothetical protein [Agarivorans sp. Alg241-V36]|uniref:hypothetical protein n=1 Tax=Agarivorans sp. Alg241-V36 TaxID=2305992 RepID=UPI0013D1FB69|nr:hypothetical protein [Agarivorans sp. Alg241-V36]